jgi:hypothetical protein
MHETAPVDRTRNNIPYINYLSIAFSFSLSLSLSLSLSKSKYKYKYKEKVKCPSKMIGPRQGKVDYYLYNKRSTSSIVGRCKCKFLIAFSQLHPNSQRDKWSTVCFLTYSMVWDTSYFWFLNWVANNFDSNCTENGKPLDSISWGSLFRLLSFFSSKLWGENGWFLDASVLHNFVQLMVLIANEVTHGRDVMWN